MLFFRSSHKVVRLRSLQLTLRKSAGRLPRDSKETGCSIRCVVVVELRRVVRNKIGCHFVGCHFVGYHFVGCYFVSCHFVVNRFHGGRRTKGIRKNGGLQWIEILERGQSLLVVVCCVSCVGASVSCLSHRVGLAHRWVFGDMGFWRRVCWLFV